MLECQKLLPYLQVVWLRALLVFRHSHDIFEDLYLSPIVASTVLTFKRRKVSHSPTRLPLQALGLRRKKMPSIKWNILLRHPFTSLKITLLGSWRSVVVLLARIIFPFRARKLSLRNALARAWIRTAQSVNSEVFCSEPRGHGCQEVVFAGGAGQKRVVGGWVVPTTDVQDLKDKDAVVLFAHGGGYAIGHGLQNLTAFRRWTKKAAAMGQKVAFVTVKYRESNDRPLTFLTCSTL